VVSLVIVAVLIPAAMSFVIEKLPSVMSSIKRKFKH
jgi:hypothetical protein